MRDGGGEIKFLFWKSYFSDGVELILVCCGLIYLGCFGISVGCYVGYFFYYGERELDLSNKFFLRFWRLFLCVLGLF